MWQCNVCSQTFHKTESAKWRARHGETNTKLVRCNNCVDKDEQQHKREQTTTFAIAMKPTLTVQIRCPHCSATQGINMDTRWSHNNEHRLCRVTCATCNVKTILGERCSSRDAQIIYVKARLQTHSYDGKTCFKHECRPPTATVALFMGRLEPATSSQQTTSSERQRQYIQDNNTNEQRRLS